MRNPAMSAGAAASMLVTFFILLPLDAAGGRPAAQPSASPAIPIGSMDYGLANVRA